jgi:hypothetical protein
LKIQAYVLVPLLQATQLQQFTMNPGSAPERVLAAHPANQIADFLRYRGPSWLSPPNPPGPKEAKALPMPADHRRRWDEKDTGPPIVPQGAQPGPQESIGRGESGPFDRALQNTEWMAQGQDFQLQRRTAPERSGKRGEERRKEGAEKEPKEERQTSTYQLHRNLREPQAALQGRKYQDANQGRTAS